MNRNEEFNSSDRQAIDQAMKCHKPYFIMKPFVKVIPAWLPMNGPVIVTLQF